MKEVRAMAATGMLGSGFSDKSLERGLSWDPDFIGCDAGSTDSGPYYLGSGTSHFSDEAVGRDIRLMLRAGQRKGIPVIVGSAGTGGADCQVNHLVGIVSRIAKEENLSFRLGMIFSEQSKDYLIARLREGKIRPLGKSILDLTEEKIKSSKRIVGMAGSEPFIEALESGAQVIIAGRSSDTSIYASLPTLRGIPPAVAWHAAKILECGAASVEQRKYPDCMFGIMREDHFIVEPPNPEYRCTPLSIASHNLYENDSPFTLREPSGILQTENAEYEAINQRAVRVSNSTFEEVKEMTIKLEGVELAGYQTLFFGSIRDPMILKQLGSWQKGLRETLDRRFKEIFGEDIRYSLNIRTYGLDGTMGSQEPVKKPAHEVCLVLEIMSQSQELSTAMGKSAAHIAVHYPVPEWSGLITSLAYPYSPPELERGPVYRFNVNHIVLPKNYGEMFRVEYAEI